MSEPDRLFYEAKVTELLGLPRDTVAYVRASILKKESGHWQLRGRDVVLTQAGLDALLAHLFETAEPDPTLDFSSCEVDPEKKEGPDLVELTVKRTFPNRLLVLATLPDGGDVTVRVKDNSNFRPKMKLKARPPAEDATGSAAFYQLEGRCPRYPGKY